MSTHPYRFLKFILVMAVFNHLACTSGHNDKRNYNHYVQDFESFDGWENPYRDNLVKGKAFSGNYFLKLDSLTGQSPVFKIMLTQLRDWPFGFVNAAAWVNSEKALAEASLVIQVVDTLKNDMRFYKELQLNSFFYKPNEWYQVKDRVKMPDDINDHCMFLVYVLDRGKTGSGVDDIEVEFSIF